MTEKHDEGSSSLIGLSRIAITTAASVGTQPAIRTGQEPLVAAV